MSSDLTVVRGAALYVGALLGPGLLMLPGLAAGIAGPASLIAWVLLLGVSGLIAIVFAHLGLRLPSSSGVQAYAEAGLGRGAGRLVRWCFLAGVITGAPIVCLIGGGYLALLLGGGRTTSLVAAVALLLAVLALTACGSRTSSSVQVGLVIVLLALVVIAVTGSAGHSRTPHWTPFAPHGWAAVGPAASTLMLGFVGWEAVAGLTARFSRPRRQVPVAVGVAFVVTSLIYLALAVVTIGVLGPRAASAVPMALLLDVAIGPAGLVLGAVAAVVLTLGTTNAYLSGAAELARASTASTAGDRRFPVWLAAVIAATGGAMTAAAGTGMMSVEAVVRIPTTFFLVVYLCCTVSAARLFTGRMRAVSLVATVAVAAVLAFCGASLTSPVAVALVVLALGRRRSVTGRAAGQGSRHARRTGNRCGAHVETQTSASADVRVRFCSHTPMAMITTAETTEKPIDCC